MSHDDIDGVWDPESKRYYYPEYTPDTQAMPSFWSDKVPWNNAHTTFTGRHGEKVSRRPKQAPMDLPQSAVEIAGECDRLKAFLIEKNLAYGNSALDPVRIFSSASTVEQLLVRIDDKLSRMEHQELLDEDGKVITNTEDTTLDLIGYLILLRIAVGREGQ